MSLHDALPIAATWASSVKTGAQPRAIGRRSVSDTAVVQFPCEPPEFGGHVVGAEQPAFDLFDVASVIPMDVIQVQPAAVLVGNESILREPHAVPRGILFDSGPFEQFFDQFSRGLRNDVVRVISGTGRYFPCSFQGGPKALASALPGPTYVRSPPPGLLDKIVDIVHAATAISEVRQHFGSSSEE